MVALGEWRGTEALPASVTLALVKDFDAVLSWCGDAAGIAVDMPVGLLDAPRQGGRECDRAARRLLGRRGVSVFSPPCRPALAARDHAEAQRLQGGGMSIQTWHIVAKIREVDAAMSATTQIRVIEAHPELAFHRLAPPGMALARKADADGRAQRIALLAQTLGPALPDLVAERRRLGPRWLKPDDLADACVLAHVARCRVGGSARRVPEAVPPCDAKGLRMEIWY